MLMRYLKRNDALARHGANIDDGRVRGRDRGVIYESAIT
jgi:hypothetical protein